MDAVIQVLAAGLGTLGFSLLFHLRPALLAHAAFCGMLAWAAYILILKETGSIAFSAFLATAAASLYSERLAAVHRVPATLFILPATLPLIPGGPLYYTMRALVAADMEQACFHAARTLQFAVGIAGGVIIAGACGLVFASLGRSGRRTIKRARRRSRRMRQTEGPGMEGEQPPSGQQGADAQDGRGSI